MHLGASIERRVQKDRKKGFSVAVVCSSGIGTSKMLSSRLAYEFKDIDSLEEYSVLDIDRVDFTNYDLVVSTIPLDLEDGVKVIEASPLLRRSEIEAISAYLSAKDERHFQSVNAKVSEIYQIVQAHCQINDADKLIQDLQRAIAKTGKRDSIQKDEGGADLWDYLNRHTVKIRRVKTDLENAIRQTAKPLLSDGKIEESYVEAMLKMTQTMPKHMVLCKGFFMPHASPQDGVNETGMSLTIYQKPIETDFEDDGIHAVLVMAAEDDAKHMTALQQLVDILNHPNLVDQLKDCKDETEALRLLKRIV
jgi:mannitol operon transcriptional antiterminator